MGPPQASGRETPKELDSHMIADNYATHKHAKVKQWLNRHPRFHIRKIARAKEAMAEAALITS